MKKVYYFFFIIFSFYFISCEVKVYEESIGLNKVIIESPKNNYIYLIDNDNEELRFKWSDLTFINSKINYSLYHRTDDKPYKLIKETSLFEFLFNTYVLDTNNYFKIESNRNTDNVKISSDEVKFLVLKKIKIGLISPADKDTLKYRSVDFMWRVISNPRDENLQHTLLIGEDTNKMENLITTGETIHRVINKFELDKKYYWRVVTKGKYNIMDSSIIRSFFTPKTIDSYLDNIIVEIIEPAKEYKMTSFTRDYEINFAWKVTQDNIKEPILHRLYFGEDQTNLKLINETSDLSYKLNLSCLTVGKKFYWKLESQTTSNYIYKNDIRTISNEETITIAYPEITSGSQDVTVRDILVNPSKKYTILGNFNQTVNNQKIFLISYDTCREKIFEKTYSIENINFGYRHLVKSDGGYMIFGSTYKLVANAYRIDAFVINTNVNGNVIWQKTYDNNSDENFYSGIEKKDKSGYVLIGTQDDPSDSKDVNDIWLCEIDNNGNILWNKFYGDELTDQGHDLVEVSDGYVILGHYSKDDASDFDIWVLKVDKTGNQIWEKKIGTPKHDDAHKIVSTSDNGVIVAGYTNATTYSTNDNDNGDFYFAKLDAGGNILWEKKYNGGFDNRSSYIIKDGNDKYIIGGWKVIDQKQTSVPFAVKVDESGNEIWNKSIDGNDKKFIFAISVLPNDELVMGGNIELNNQIGLLIFTGNK